MDWKKSKKIESDDGIKLTPDKVERSHINWYPGHMNKAIRQIKEKVKMVDVILEVRDGRSPLVTGNSVLTNQLGGKARLIVVNKSGLADPIILELWKKWYATKTEDVIFINSFDKATLKLLIEKAKSVVTKMRLESNPDYQVSDKLKMMIIGLPNTGKSTIINKLANRNAAKAADRPGITQSQLWVDIDSDLSILDTPGIMPPKIQTYEQGLWLSALHAIPDGILTPEVPACFIVKHMLALKAQGFKERYKFESMELELVEALEHIAKVRGCIRQKGEPDFERVYQVILSDFRSGELGPVSFGVPPVKNS